MNPGNPLQRLAEAIDTRDRRERLLLGVTVAVVVLVIWEGLVRAPLGERQASAVDNVAQLEDDLAAVRDTHASLEAQIEQLSGDSRDSRIDQLRKRIEQADATLAERTARLISPQQMMRALRGVVNADAAISLVRLRNAGAQPVITQGSASSADAEGDNAAAVPRVYRHDVELVVEGRYLALLDYLREIEGLEWQFQWQSLTIETRTYPVTRATITLSTLSLAEDWIGV